MAINTKNAFRKTLVTIGIVLAVNILGSFLFKRFDLTSDQRYTLSPVSRTILKQAEEPLYVDIFLEGQFPGEFKRLQTETRQLLEEYKAYNRQIIFQFINPLDKDQPDESKQALIYELVKLKTNVRTLEEEKKIKAGISQIPDLDKALLQVLDDSGLRPISVTVEDKGKQTQEVVFPWAIATYKDKSVKVPLLKNLMGASTQDKVVSSVQHLEYAFANAFNTITVPKTKKVAVLKGNGELPDLLMADFIQQVREQYYIGTFTMDSVAKKPVESAAYLKKYDLAIIAKPQEAFTDAEKQVLDQFIVNGGKTLWMIDAVHMEMDSLYNNTGTTLAFPNDLNLNDMLFKYGVRIQPELVKDEQATPIKLATGQQGSGTQYTQYFWRYSPLVYPDSNNPIVRNIDGLHFEFVNPIDTLKNGIKKTILLKTSKYSKRVGTPTEIKLSSVAEETKPEDYAGQGNIPVAVLLEGKFHSVYENRVLPFEDQSFIKEGAAGKMILVSDGDIVRNQLDKNYQPLELGFDKWTNAMYGNKDFMMNCVNYLLDDKGLIGIRSKDVKLAMLDKQKVEDEYTRSQVLTIGLPLAVLLVFGVVFGFVRKRMYGR